MNRLSPTSIWSDNQIKQKLDFLESAVALEDSAVSKAYALCEAPELCLATGDTPEGARLVDRCLEFLFDQKDKSVPSQFALLGAAFGKVEVSVSASGMSVRPRSTHAVYAGEPRTFKWGGPSKLLIEGIGMAIAATLASNRELPSSLLSLIGEPTRVEEAEQLGPQVVEDPQRIALLAANSPEADFLPSFGLQRTSEGFFSRTRNGPQRLSFDPGTALLYSMEVRYARGIRLAAEHVDWRNLCSRVPLIDWRLLCLEIAMARQHRGDLPPHDLESGSFMRTLAQDIQLQEPL